MLLKLLALCLFTFLIYIPIAEARIRHYKWEVKYEYKSPDCYKKLVTTINGKSPGPTILAQEGDTVIVEVTNKLLLENLAIHWHGIRQIGTPWSDGTEGVTQCPVVPGDTFKYEFKVDRAGTYLYHAHYGMQRESGLYGSIRVSVPDNFTEPFAYDYDRSIILTDWYHKSTYEQATGLSSIPFVWVGEPQSLLIQGKGKFNCSSASLTADTCNTSNPECSPYAITIIPGKTYRLRVASLTTLSALSFQIEGHNMTVVEADGHYVEPFVVKNLFIYSGETYSVLIKADQDPSRNYWMTTNVISRPPNTTQGLGFLNYYPNHPRRSPPTVPPAGPIWNDTAPRLAQSLAIKAHQDFIVTSPTTSDRAIVFLNTQNRINGYVHWSVNNVSFTLPHTPYLTALKNKLHHVFNQTPPPEGYDSVNYDIYNVSKNPNATTSNAIYRLGFNTTVDIILQNANTMNVNNSETHPWHLHGHDFWVLGYGDGKFDMNKDPKKYNLVNPIMKNTVPLHPYGWTALRFKADNPGAWLFHCHIDAHFYLGMGVVFEEGIEKGWVLILQRNRVRLNQQADAIHQITHTSRAWLADFHARQVSHGAQVNHTQPTNCRWKPSPSGLFKINFDGAVCQRNKKSGIGVVIRDNIASCSKAVHQVIGSADIEAMTAAWALSFALDVGVKHAVLEGDSLAVIKGLRENESLLVPCGLLLEDAKILSRQFDQLHYSHTKREGNGLVHSLARYAVSIPDFVIWMGMFHYNFFLYYKLIYRV